MSPAEALRLLQIMRPTVLALMPGTAAAANDLLQVGLPISCLLEIGHIWWEQACSLLLLSPCLI